jgi:hypothetical protein
MGGGRFRLAAGVLLLGALALDAAEVIEGAEVRTLEGGDAGGDFVQEFGGGGVAENGDVEVFGTGAFVEESTVQLGFETLEAAFLPVGTDQGFDVEVLDGGLGLELAVVAGGEGVVGGGVFAGDDDGSGVHSMFEGVEAGGGLAFGRGSVDFWALRRFAAI